MSKYNFEFRELESRLEMQSILLPDGSQISADGADEAIASCEKNCGSCSGSECLVR